MLHHQVWPTKLSPDPLAPPAIWQAMVIQDGVATRYWGKQLAAPAAIVLHGLAAADSRSTTGAGRLQVCVPKNRR